MIQLSKRFTTPNVKLTGSVSLIKHSAAHGQNLYILKIIASN